MSQGCVIVKDRDVAVSTGPLLVVLVPGCHIDFYRGNRDRVVSAIESAFPSINFEFCADPEGDDYLVIPVRCTVGDGPSTAFEQPEPDVIGAVTAMLRSFDTGGLPLVN